MKVLFHQNLTWEKLRESLLYEKCARKMLMKLTPGHIFLMSCKPRKWLEDKERMKNLSICIIDNIWINENRKNFL